MRERKKKRKTKVTLESQRIFNYDITGTIKKNLNETNSMTSIEITNGDQSGSHSQSKSNYE